MILAQRKVLGLGMCWSGNTESVRDLRERRVVCVSVERPA